MNDMICGIDEAGRGCLAGPMAVAGVILAAPVEGLADSKKLTAKKREELEKEILERCPHHVVLVDSQKIDEIGLSPALQGAIREIMEALGAERYVMDGNTSFGIRGLEHMVKADDKVPAVSAASILAKVARDRELARRAGDYPQFSFAKHKGYGTKAHIGELEKFGPTPLHRKSFRVKSLEQPTLF